MTDRVIKAIKDFDMLKYGDKVLVGISGGADSVSLLTVLCKLKNKMNLEITAAHINHGLRGNESDEDEIFTKKLCDSLEVPIFVLKADVKKEALKTGCGIEECGRNIRYNYFNETSATMNAKIATAHTLSDNLETLILNLTRGSGLNGMCGIKPVRNNIIRPLIYLTRDEIEQYCVENNLDYVIDKSNYDRNYSRNKIRLDVIPILKEINPSVEKTCLKMISQFTELKSYIDNKALRALKEYKLKNGYNAEKLVRLDKTVLSRCISFIVESNLNNNHIDLIIEKLKEGSGSVTVPGGINIDIKFGRLNINTGKKERISWEYKINNTKILTYYKREVIIKVIDIMEYIDLIKLNKELIDYSIDYKYINENTIIRNRRNSDKFKKAGRKVTKTLKKLFNEEKVPICTRDDLVIIANKDKIVWLEGFGASEFALVNKETKKVLIIFLKECNHGK